MQINSQHFGQLLHVAGVLQRAAENATQRDASLYLKTAQALQSRATALRTGAAASDPAPSPAPLSQRLVDVLA
jgi:hypothetical protein